MVTGDGPVMMPQARTSRSSASKNGRRSPKTPPMAANGSGKACSNTDFGSTDIALHASKPCPIASEVCVDVPCGSWYHQDHARLSPEMTSHCNCWLTISALRLLASSMPREALSAGLIFATG
jgi:hypothetical protein